MQLFLRLVLFVKDHQKKLHLRQIILVVTPLYSAEFSGDFRRTYRGLV